MISTITKRATRGTFETHPKDGVGESTYKIPFQPSLVSREYLTRFAEATAERLGITREEEIWFRTDTLFGGDEAFFHIYGNVKIGAGSVPGAYKRHRELVEQLGELVDLHIVAKETARISEEQSQNGSTGEIAIGVHGPVNVPASE